MTSEAELINRIRRAIPSRRRGILHLGIGDDAAVLRLPRQSLAARSHRLDWVLTSDSFLANRHFTVSRHPPHAVGYKALARALGDIAAMGASPNVFLLNLALPNHLTGSWLDQFLKGIAQAARAYRVVLAGGDTARSRSVAVCISLLGEVPSGRAVHRSGARPGDLLYVSGVLGAAQLGLITILKSGKPSANLLRNQALQRHLYPVPRLKLGQWLAQTGLASAMIDTSDGFSTDLAHLCDASRVGALVSSFKLPVVNVPASLRPRNLAPLELALHGGEDYELLFAVSPKYAHEIPDSFHGVRLSRVGVFTRLRGIRLVDANGHTSKLAARGWDHFRRGLSSAY